MHRKKISSTIILFWTLIVALVSAISTTIFSESSLNDGFGFSLMVIASIGLLINIAYLCIDTLISICNPSN